MVSVAENARKENIVTEIHVMMRLVTFVQPSVFRGFVEDVIMTSLTI